MTAFTIEKSIAIHSPVSKVWQILIDPQFSTQWASAFSEGSLVESEWKKGSNVLWKDKEGNVGARGIVETAEANRLLTVSFYNDLNIAPGSARGDYSETYALSDEKDGTLLSVKAGPLTESDYKQHLPLWDQALQKMKDIAEK